MKKILVLALASALVGGAALAVWNAQDFVPAATLLVPYAVVASTADNTVNPAGYTTLFAITNVSSRYQLVHLCVWTCLSNPVVDWDVYMTGFDVWSINFADLLNGSFDKFDTGLTYWPTSVDPNYNWTTPHENWGPNTNPSSFNSPVIGGSGVATAANLTAATCVMPYGPLPQVGDFVRDLIRADQAPLSYQYINCGTPATQQGNTTWTNALSATTPFFFYVTADAVTACTKNFQNTPDYWVVNVNESRNVLVGDIIYLNPTTRHSEMINAVHLEAGFPATAYETFYEIALLGTDAEGDAGTDNREPLGTAYAFRYATKDVASNPYQNEILVWKSQHDLNLSSYSRILACQAYRYWAWNEDEMTKRHGGSVSGQSYYEQNAIPFETQAVTVNLANFPGLVTLPTGPKSKGGVGFGWMYLDFDENASYIGSPYAGADFDVVEAYVINRFVFGDYSAAAEAQLMWTPFNRTMAAGAGASLSPYGYFPLHYYTYPWP